MTRYASVADLRERWRDFEGVCDVRRAQTLLDDASAELDAMGAGDAPEAVKRIVVCNMARRALQSVSLDAYGVKQASETVGPYTNQWTFANPDGDMYVTAAERRMLGLSAKRVGSLCPVGLELP